MLNQLEAAIQKAIADSAVDLANRIGQVVRQSLAAEISGSSSGAVVRRGPGRPPGSVNKAGGGGGRRRRRGITQAELDAVLNVLRKKPGSRSVDVQAEAGIDKKQAARVFNKLRLTGAVKMKGTRSKATYTVA
jgi:hypothetical protein